MYIAIQDYLYDDRELYPHCPLLLLCIVLHNSLYNIVYCCYQINFRFFQTCCAVVKMSDSDVKPTHDLISVNVNEKTHKKQLFLTGNISVCVSLSVSRKRLQTLTISLCSGMLQCSAAPPAGGLWMTVAGEPQSSQAGPTRGV